MNIGEEKQHIYSIMKDITEERRKLSDMYFDLKKRLDELNTMEFRGLEDLNVSGYVDLFNQHRRETAVTNIERETKHVIEKLKEEPKEEKVISSELLEEERDKTSSKKGKYLNIDKVLGVIAHVLKESEVPLSVKELHERVSDKLDGENVQFLNFRNNILRRAQLNNKCIQKAGRGFYQYVRN